MKLKTHQLTAAAGLSGAPLAALVFCAAMYGALHTLVGPGFSFDWIPHLPAGGGAAVAVVSSILPMVPYWIGFLALLLTLTASEYAYFTSIFGNGTGLRWPGEWVNR